MLFCSSPNTVAKTFRQTLLSWHFVLHHCFSYSQLYLPILLALYFAFCISHAIMFTDTFKCVNIEAIGLYAIIFDGLYGSSTLSSLLSTLVTIYRHYIHIYSTTNKTNHHSKHFIVGLLGLKLFLPPCFNGT